MSAKCCAMRTGVLFFGFTLGTAEVMLWVMFYTFRQGEAAIEIHITDDRVSQCALLL